MDSRNKVVFAPEIDPSMLQGANIRADNDARPRPAAQTPRTIIYTKKLPDPSRHQLTMSTIFLFHTQTLCPYINSPIFSEGQNLLKIG